MSLLCVQHVVYKNTIVAYSNYNICKIALIYNDYLIIMFLSIALYYNRQFMKLFGQKALT